MTLDPDDLPGYLHDAYAAALEHGLQSLNLTRIGGGENRMWQASSRFTRSSGFHVSIEADLFEALLGALGAWTRVDKAPAAPEPAPAAPEPEREIYDGVTAADLEWAATMDPPAEPETGLFD